MRRLFQGGLQSREIRESSLKEKDQYKSPPYTNQYKSATFDIEKYFFLSTKQAILTRRFDFAFSYEILCGDLWYRAIHFF